LGPQDGRFPAFGLLGGPDVHACSVSGRLEFHGSRRITRWRPLVQWLLAIPQFMIASALRTLRQILPLISVNHAEPGPPHEPTTWSR
jgi:hypothetical protein